MTQNLGIRKSILQTWIVVGFLTWGTCSHSKMVAVKGDNVNLRSGPGTAYSIKWEYGLGFPLVVKKEKGDWLQVKDFEDEEGWIHRSLVEYSPHTIVIANRNNDGTILIRNEPTMTGSIVAKSYYGVVFAVLRKENGWVKVRHESGLTGWAKEELLWGY